MDNAPIIDHNRTGGPLAEWLDAGAHQMEPPCPLISWVNLFPRRFINRTNFFCNAWIAWMRSLPSARSKTILLSFLYFHWFFPLLARETSWGNCSIYKSTRERVDSNGFYGRWRLHLMGSCWMILVALLFICLLIHRSSIRQSLFSVNLRQFWNDLNSENFARQLTCCCLRSSQNNNTGGQEWIL